MKVIICLVCIVVWQSTAAEKCPPFDFGSEADLLVNQYRVNLDQEGPQEGTCDSNEVYWILNGIMFNKRTKCSCFPESKAPEVNSNDKGAVKCANFQLGLTSDYMKDFWAKNFAMSPPTNGFCDVGKIKFFLTPPGYDTQGCFCGDAYQVIDFSNYKQRY